MKIVFLFLLLFSVSMPKSYGVCLDLLSGYIDVEFDTAEKRDDKAVEIVDAIYGSAPLNLGGLTPEFRDWLRMMLHRQLTLLYNEVALIKFGGPLAYEAKESALKSLIEVNSWNTSIDNAYGGFANVLAYRMYLSPVQSLVSYSVVGYGIVHAGLNPNQHYQILELGTGAGDTAEAIHYLLPKAEITFTDKFVEPLKATLRRFAGLSGRIDQIHAAKLDFADPLPFADESYDLIVSISAASQYLEPEHFADLLVEAHRVLKPGGLLIFEVGPHVFGLDHKLPYLEMKKLFTAAGFLPETWPGLVLKFGESRVLPILLRKY